MGHKLLQMHASLAVAISSTCILSKLFEIYPNFAMLEVYKEVSTLGKRRGLRTVGGFDRGWLKSSSCSFAEKALSGFLS